MPNRTIICNSNTTTSIKTLIYIVHRITSHFVVNSHTSLSGHSCNAIVVLSCPKERQCSILFHWWLLIVIAIYNMEDILKFELSPLPISQFQLFIHYSSHY